MANDRKKTVNAKQAANDVRSGMTDAELKNKYVLSDRGLEVLLRKLVDAGLLQQHDLDVRTRASSIPEEIVWKCPSCGSLQTRVYDECPDCGVIIAKLKAKHKGFADRHDDLPQPSSLSPARPIAAGGMQAEQPPVNVLTGVATPAARATLRAPDYEETPEEVEDPDDRPLEPRTMDKPEWTMLLVGPAVALVCLALFWPWWILQTFKTLAHEMGHAIFGWAFGYPSLPAFDFLWGGGVTLHFDRSTSMLILVYMGLGALIYLYRKNTSTVIFLVLVALFHALFSYTDFNSVIILFMGHGTELVIGGLFIYRSLSGRSIIHPWERPLYAVIGFFLIFADIAFGFNLLRDAGFREEYLEGKGGVIDNDFIRIARDHLHVKMNSVVIFFLFCSVITPILSFLAFRYEEYIHSVVAALWVREPEQP
jgi:hypothetical protein